MMKRQMKYHITQTAKILAVMLWLTGCENKDLFLCPPDEEQAVNVIIHWEGKEASTLPEEMRLHCYLQPDESTFVSTDVDSKGGTVRLSDGIYRVACFDFYYESNRLRFRGEAGSETFEVYNVSRTSLYNQYADPVPAEPTVAEANPYVFYSDGRFQSVDTKAVAPGEVITLHFYPQNALREFTFLIYGVQGAKNMTQSAGAISGMSASYYPATGKLADKPSTILFTRATPLENGQKYAWDNEQKSLFTQLNPLWESNDPDKGWTDDWIIGKFCTFGPVNLQSLHFRLTLEALNKNNRYYYGAWGYWYGQWEDAVGLQIQGAMGGINGKGTPEEQLAWRQQNGGFDIILYNDGRLIVPGDDPGGKGKGGFEVETDPWEPVVIPPAG
jgi:hypothetical protein